MALGVLVEQTVQRRRGSWGIVTRRVRLLAGYNRGKLAHGLGWRVARTTRELCGRQHRSAATCLYPSEGDRLLPASMVRRAGPLRAVCATR